MDTLEQIGVQRWRKRNKSSLTGSVLSSDENPAITSIKHSAEPHAEDHSSVQHSLVQHSSVQESSGDVGAVADHHSTQKSASEAVPEPSSVVDSGHAAADQSLEPVTTTAVTEPSATGLSATGSAAASPSIAQGPQFSWQDLASIVENNQNCESCRQTHPVLGDGSLEADWVFIIDAPTAKDMQHQQLLSGRSGELFDAILRAVGQTRQSIYLSSVFKCPASSDLSLTAQCGDLIYKQLALLKPKVVMTLGEFAAQYILRSNDDLSTLRTVDHRSASGSSTIISSFAITDMLEKPLLKAEFWRDLQKCLENL